MKTNPHDIIFQFQFKLIYSPSNSIFSILLLLKSCYDVPFLLGYSYTCTHIERLIVRSLDSIDTEWMALDDCHFLPILSSDQELLVWWLQSWETDSILVLLSLSQWYPNLDLYMLYHWYWAPFTYRYCKLYLDWWLHKQKNGSHQVPLTMCLCYLNLDLHMLYHWYWAHFIHKYSQPHNYIIKIHTQTYSIS